VKVFVVLPSDLSEDDWAYVNEEEVKCGCCLWNVTKLFVLADSKEEAVELVKRGDAGLCGECFAELLAEEGFDFEDIRQP
jgi:hypothetical protein